MGSSSTAACRDSPSGRALDAPKCLNFSYGWAVEYLSILGGRGRRIDEQVAHDLGIHELLDDIFGDRNDDFLRSLYLEPLDNEEVAVFRLTCSEIC